MEKPKKTIPLCVICNDFVHFPYCGFCMNGGECHIDGKYYNDEGYVEGVYHQKCLPVLGPSAHLFIAQSKEQLHRSTP